MKTTNKYAKKNFVYLYSSLDKICLLTSLKYYNLIPDI